MPSQQFAMGRFCGIALLVLGVLCAVQGGSSSPRSSLASKQAQLIQSLSEHVVLPSGSISISSPPRGALSGSRLAHAQAGPADEEALHPTSTQLSFSAFGRTFELSLEKNHELISPNYVEERIDGSTGAVLSRKTRSDVLNCYYHGSVKSFNGPSMNLVAVDTCSGLRGAIHAFGASYWIEPLESSKERTLAMADHLMYRLADLPQDNNVYTCGVNNEPLNFQWLFTREDDATAGPGGRPAHDHSHSHSNGETHSHSHSSFGVPLSMPTFDAGTPRLMGTNYYVELAIMNDIALFNHHRLDTETNSGALFNLAAGYYAASSNAFLADSVVLILVAQKTVVNGTDPWPVVLDSNSQINPKWLLGNFTNYQRISMNTPALAHDDSILLSGITFTQPIIGLAYIGGVCDVFNMAGVVQANHYTNKPFDAATLAHELGHNLGMCHDPPGTRDSDYCPTLSTSNPNVACASSIMSTSSDPNNPASTFSPCSGEDFRYNLVSRAPGCLGVPPTSRSWFNTSTCGNGFIEQGEGCDCRGYANCSLAPGDWYDPCCNGTTCQLIAGSTCSLAYGCCQQASNGSCQVVPASANKVCKGSDSSSCLLESVCTGASAVCPDRATDSNCNSGLVDKAKQFFQNNWMWILLGVGVLVVLGLFYSGFKRCTSDPQAEKEQRRARRREAREKAKEKRDIAMAERASLQDAQRQPHAPAFNVGAGSAPMMHQHQPPAYNPASAPVHHAPAAPAPQVLQLPPGWTVVMVDGQHPVYINEATGEQYDFRTMAPQGSAMYS